MESHQGRVSWNRSLRIPVGRRPHADSWSGPVARASACGPVEQCVLDAFPRSARDAREFVDARLCTVHAGRARTAVTLAASEFTTHAALLGTGPVTLTTQCQIATVILAAEYPVPADEDASYDSRLRLFDEISTKVIKGISRTSGSGPHDGGWRLWCHIPTGWMPSSWC